MSTAALTGILALGLFVASRGTASAGPQIEPEAHSPSPDRGMVVFQAYCVGCHGQNGTGDGPVAGKLHTDFGVRPTDLSAASFQRQHSDEQISTSVRGGGKAVHMSAYMPAWGTTLSDQQVTDLVSYVRELKPEDNDSSAAIVAIGDQLELGRILYTLRCLACHGPEGRGDGPYLDGKRPPGSKVPNFSTPGFFHKRTDESLEDVLYRGISHSGLLPETEPGWWDRPLEPDEMASLILYLRALPLLDPPHSRATPTPNTKHNRAASRSLQ